MATLKYKCMRCGTCCSIPKDNNGNYLKRIPLYPEEVSNLIEIAQKRNLALKVKEDLVFPDILNKKIIVLTYRFILDDSGYCIFHDINLGCTIQENKPLSCQAYPLALKIIDAFNM
ncbi:MAG: YkgJ family cysteine cluster protein, partial [Candidatus Thorarchaeota archaeon]